MQQGKKAENETVEHQAGVCSVQAARVVALAFLIHIGS